MSSSTSAAVLFFSCLSHSSERDFKLLISVSRVLVYWSVLGVVLLFLTTWQGISFDSRLSTY